MDAGRDEERAADHAPEEQRASELRRKEQRASDLRRKEHIEPWLVWNATRTRPLSQGTRPISVGGRKNSVLDIKVFLDTITEWGWEESPGRPLLFNSDLPKLDQPLPRYIPQEQEVRLMAAIRELPDPIQRYSLEILRATGMRIGELLNLELDCLHEAPGQGTWLKVPIGKLYTERMVPVSNETVASHHRAPWRHQAAAASGDQSPHRVPARPSRPARQPKRHT